MNNAERKIVYANSSYCEIVGYCKEELMERDYNEFLKMIHVDDIKEVNQKTRKAQENPELRDKVLNVSYKIHTKQGEIKRIGQYSKRIKYKNRDAYLFNSNDISSRK